MEFPSFISWTSPFLKQGLYGGIHIFYSDFNRTFLKKKRGELDQMPKKKFK